MKIIQLLALYLCVVFSSSTVFAQMYTQMYKWVDKDGNISYSDQPPHKGAAQLDAPALTTMQPTPPKKSKAPDASDKEDEAPTVYSYLKITSPQDDMTIRDNSGNFSISIGIKPALNTDQGHSLSLSLDGKVIKSKLTSTSISLTNIDRGTHKFSVSIKDKAGKTLHKSKSTTIHMYRQIVKQKQAK